MKRISIATCMASIMILAIGSAALTHPSELWASTIFTLAVVLLSWASVAALLRRGSFWAASAVLGWVYLVLSLGMFGARGTQTSPFPAPPPLLTSKAIESIERRMFETTPVSPGPVATTSTTYANTPFRITYLGTPNQSHIYFHQICHCLLALIVAIVGGFLAVLVLREAAHPLEPSES